MGSTVSAVFAIVVEPRISLVRITMGGFFAETDIAAFARDLGKRMQTLRCAPNRHLTRCDVSAMKYGEQV